MSRSWLSYSTAEIDLGVERMHERALARYEHEVDRASAERDAREAALQAGGWDPSEAHYVSWLEGLVPEASVMGDRMDVLRRFECPSHGDTLSAAVRSEGRRWCHTCTEWVHPVEVEYVRLDRTRGPYRLLTRRDGRDRHDGTRRGREPLAPQARRLDLAREAKPSP